MLWLGIDAGGSGSRAVWIDAKGHVVHRTESGPANWATTPRQALIENLEELAASDPAAEFACFCMAGILTERDKQDAANVVQRLIPGTPFRVLPDYAALPACADADICVLSGTGSAVISVQDGEVHRTGAGGALLGDDGSAFALGRLALREIFLFERVKMTDLPILAESVGLDKNRDEVLASIYSSASPTTAVAQLAEAVLQESQTGNDLAMRWVMTVLDDLAGVFLQHMEHYPCGKSEIRVALAGGLWKGAPNLGTMFQQKIVERNANLQPTVLMELEHEPVVGAALLAQKMKS